MSKAPCAIFIAGMHQVFLVILCFELNCSYLPADEKECTLTREHILAACIHKPPSILSGIPQLFIDYLVINCYCHEMANACSTGNAGLTAK